MRFTQAERNRERTRTVEVAGRPPFVLLDTDSLAILRDGGRPAIVLTNYAGRLAVLSIDHAAIANINELR
jgi:hypothetical protein